MHHLSQPLRIENPEYVSLITSRTLNSALWFVNNKALEQHILGYLAKYQHKYNVEIFSFSIQGNHTHMVARFSDKNMAPFMRDLNARIAEGVRIHVAEFIGGPVFYERYSEQKLPLQQDVEKYFLYTALQAVNDGLAERISQYPGYNSVYNAINAKVKKYKVVDYGKYNARRRFNKRVPIEDFTEWFPLEFSRLPGKEELSQKEYAKEMLKKLELERMKKVQEWKDKKHSFPTKKQLQSIVPGSFPFKTKKGNIKPIVLSCCQETKKKVLSWYFEIVSWYQKASKQFRDGELGVEFPPGTYPPMPGISIPP